MNTHKERGIALVLALFLMSAMSVLAASLMFLSQTETYASMNYRMMSQARYAGEAAVQKASDFLLDNTQYVVPSSSSAIDPLSNYLRTGSPVLCNGGGCTVGAPIVLSATASVPSNYPAAAVQTAFDAAAQGALAAGPVTVNYGAYATLISMQTFQAFGGTQNVIQTWEITGVGSLAGSRPATVEVVAVVETPKVPANNFAAFATADTCGAMTFVGNTETNSYDSTGMTGSTAPTLDEDGGDVGTNGNLSISGAVDVNGNLYTPRTGVGTCEEGAVTALTETGHADVNGSIVKLPTAVTYPTPPLPAPSPTADVSLTSGGTTATTCAALGLDPLPAMVNCSVTGNDITITNNTGAALSLPSVSLSAHVNLILTATTGPAQYTFNSISLAGGSEIKVAATAPTQAVLVNVVGKNPDNTDIAIPINFVGGTFAGVEGCATCSAFDASMLQFVYGGSGEIIMTGNSGAATTIYAPDAAFTLQGTADIYGSVLARTVTIPGTANIHYDRRLGRDFYVTGRPMVGTFTWKRY
jgi:hypothetical protein